MHKFAHEKLLLQNRMHLLKSELDNLDIDVDINAFVLLPDNDTDSNSTSTATGMFRYSVPYYYRHVQFPCSIFLQVWSMLLLVCSFAQFHITIGIFYYPVPNYYMYVQLPCSNYRYVQLPCSILLCVCSVTFFHCSILL